MTQPTRYTAQTDYSDTLTSSEVPGDHGADLDAEFAAVRSTLNQICDNLAVIQRDDTALKNASVHPDSLSTATKALIASDWTPRGLWVTATAYVVGDVVQNGAGGPSYVCSTAHTASALFATDESAKWVKLSSNVSSDIAFTQSGTGAVEDTVQGAIRQLPFVNVLDFCSAADRALVLAGTRVDITAELTLAAATKKRIILPRGKYELSSPVGIETDLYGEGAYTNGATKYGADILLTGTGQLTFDQQNIDVQGIYIASAVNSLTFVKITAQGVRFHNFQLIGTGTSQVGIEIDTMQGASAGAVSFLDIDHFKISGIATCFKLTDTSYCNGNKIGSKGCNLAGFTTAFSIENTGGGLGYSEVGGYCESSVDPSSIFKLSAGTTLQYNRMDVWKDAGSASMDVVNNSAGGTVNVNYWPAMPPNEWQESGTVSRQIFADKTYVRATLAADQTGIADATFTLVEFDTEAFDNAAVFTSSRLTAKRSMRLRVTATAAVSGNMADGDVAFLSIYKNNSEVKRATAYFGGTSGSDLIVTDIIDVVSGDYLEIFARGDQAGGSDTHTVAGGTLGAAVTFEEL